MERTEIQFTAMFSFVYNYELGKTIALGQLLNKSVWGIWSFHMVISCKIRITNQKTWHWNVKARWMLFFITGFFLFFSSVRQWTCPILPLTITVLFYKWRMKLFIWLDISLAGECHSFNKDWNLLLSGLALDHFLYKCMKSESSENCSDALNLMI